MYCTNAEGQRTSGCNVDKRPEVSRSCRNPVCPDDTAGKQIEKYIFKHLLSTLTSPSANVNEKMFCLFLWLKLSLIARCVYWVYSVLLVFEIDPLDCDFEKDLCRWQQVKGDHSDWIRNQGKTKSSYTGPNGDNTHKNLKGWQFFFFFFEHFLQVETKKESFVNAMHD